MTGATAALALAEALPHATIEVFDQGRGLGGRTTHRRLRVDDAAVVSPLGPPAEPVYEFDHGCQFFRADTARFRAVVDGWCERGWAQEWRGRFGTLPGSGGSDGAGADFFGLPSQPPFFCGVGGAHTLAIELLAAATGSAVSVRTGTRVASIRPAPGDETAAAPPAWQLSGTSGPAAFHDTSEACAQAADPNFLGEFDAVLVTDVSASMGQWHRASAGVPEALARRVRGRVRVALFAALVAFDAPVPTNLDAAAVSGDGALWFAARTASKPGFNGGCECWTLVSTPAYAAAEVERVPMQDPETGAFIPQTPEYLRDGPCALLLAAFAQSVGAPMPKVLHLSGQRWGSAFPAPAGRGGRDEDGRGPDTTEVLGVAYEAGVPPLVPEAGDQNAAPARSFLADDPARLYYAGDYASLGPPGVESACLSALDAAAHIAEVLG